MSMRKSDRVGIVISIIIAAWLFLSIVFKSALGFIMGTIVLTIVWPFIVAVIFWIIWDHIVGTYNYSFWVCILFIAVFAFIIDYFYLFNQRFPE